MSLELFHPVIQQWFRGRFAAPTEPQELGWPDLVAGRDVLVAAPTGSGKTLMAFLAAIDRLLRLALRNELTDEIRVVYVSPLRALSNDMHRNLEVPLAEILAVAAELGLEIAPIRVGPADGRHVGGEADGDCEAASADSGDDIRVALPDAHQPEGARETKDGRDGDRR